MKSIENLLDDLLAAATGKPRAETSFDSLLDEKAAPVARCSMCGTPGASHSGLLACVTDLRHKMADLPHDQGYLPAPHVPMRPFKEIEAEAHRNWLAKPSAWRAAHPWYPWPDPTPIPRR